MKRGRKTALLCLLAAILAVLTAVCAAAEEEHGEVVDSGKCGDDLTWTVYGDGLLEISGEGEMSDYDPFDGNPMPWLAYADKLTALKLNEGITRIGELAFYDLDSLGGGLVIPDSVLSVGAAAFADCQGFTESLTLGSRVAVIEEDAFYLCSGISGSLVIPDSVTSIGAWAFFGCSSLTEVTVGAGVASVGEAAFASTESLPAIAAADGNPAYRSVDGILYTADGKTLVQCPAGRTGETELLPTTERVNAYALYLCDDLTGTLTIPEGVTSIGTYGFAFCRNLTGSLILPECLTFVGELAFYHCDGITGTLTVPAALTSVEEGAFAAMESLSAIEAAPGNTAFVSEDGVLCTADRKTLVQVPAGKTGGFAILPGVEVISSHAFDCCKKLEGTLTIPDSVTSIGRRAFYRCCGIGESVILPKGLDSIGWEAFRYCEGIGRVYFTGNAPETFGTDDYGTSVFDNCAPDFAVFYLEEKTGFTVPEWMGYPCSPVGRIPGAPIPGDMNNDGYVDSDDAIYLLRHTMTPDRYPVSGPADVNGDGSEDARDAVYLLRHVLLPDDYPLA